MSSALRERLHAAAATPPVPVSTNAIEVEVARRRRIKRGIGAAGVVAVAAAVGASLTLASTPSPHGTARLNVSPPPQPSASGRPAVTPTLQLAWKGQPRDGATATVTGSGFRPGASVQIVPCQPNAECANQPEATVQADGAGTFSVSITAHLVIPDGYGSSAMCAQNCKFAAISDSGPVAAETPTFDLVTLPPASEQCSIRALRLIYTGPGARTPGSRSAVFRVRNEGTSACWVYGPGDVGLDDQPPLPNVGWAVGESAPAWPPKVVTLQAGGTARFTVNKPVCPGTSIPLTEILFGDLAHNGNVPLPGGAQTELALCTGVAGPAPNLPAPENVLTVSAYTAN